MKRILLITLILILSNCSFDNKTGIWKNNNAIEVSDYRFKDFKKLNTQRTTFNEIIKPKDDLFIKLNPQIIPLKWLNKHFQKSLLPIHENSIL